MNRVRNASEFEVLMKNYRGYAREHFSVAVQNGGYTWDITEMCLSLKPLNECPILQVALGKTHEIESGIDFLACVNSQKTAQSISVFGQELPDPPYDVTLKTGKSITKLQRTIPIPSNRALFLGAKMPLGRLATRVMKPGKYCFTSYDEFIVYQPKQVIIRYIVAFKDH